MRSQFLTLEIAFSNAFDEIWISFFTLQKSESYSVIINSQSFIELSFLFPNKAGINLKFFLTFRKEKLISLFFFSVVFFFSDLKSLLESLTCSLPVSFLILTACRLLPLFIEYTDLNKKRPQEHIWELHSHAGLIE